MSLTFQKGADEELSYPLTVLPPGDSLIVSPRIGEDHCEAPPAVPGSEAFRKELGIFVLVRIDVESGVWPGWYFESQGLPAEVPEPLKEHVVRKGKYNPQLAAELVHMDRPDDLARVCMDWLKEEGVRTKDRGEHVEFVEENLGLGSDLADDLEEAMELAFESKWFHGQTRPEEYLLTPEGELGNLTSYPEGCPCHPSYPAGHGTAAGRTLRFLREHFELTEEQDEELAATCGHFAHYRTLAGVHWPEDNAAGLELGSRVEA